MRGEIASEKSDSDVPFEDECVTPTGASSSKATAEKRSAPAITKSPKAKVPRAKSMADWLEKYALPAVDGGLEDWAEAQMDLL